MYRVREDLWALVLMQLAVLEALLESDSADVQTVLGIWSNVERSLVLLVEIGGQGGSQVETGGQIGSQA